MKIKDSLTYLILTGGKSSRFGEDKSMVHFGDGTLLQHILSTIPNGHDVVVVGPALNLERDRIIFTREKPISGGPVAGLAAGLREVKTQYVGVIATDIPFAARAIDQLAKEMVPGSDGIVPVDSQGFQQTLCAIYRVAALQEALVQLGEPDDKAVRSLIANLSLTKVHFKEGFEGNLLDIDTRADLEIAAERLRKENGKAMKEWIEAVRKELNVFAEAEVDEILDAARDAAHAVERKAAPITTFLLGHAVAQGADLKEASAKIAALAKNWPPKE